MELLEIVEALQRMGVALELSGANPFKARAFASAARTLEREPKALALIDAGQVDSLPGIGKGLAADIGAMRHAGRFAALDELLAGIPPGLFEILELPGLGPKRVRTIWQDLGATNLGELEYACLENRLKDLKGFGPATQSKVLAAIDFAHRNRGLHLMSSTWTLADALLPALAALPGVAAVAVVGSVRRAALVSADLDLLVAHNAPARLPEGLATLPGIARARSEPAAGRPLRWLIDTEAGVPIELLACAPADWGWSLLRATGSRAHVAALEQRAKERGVANGAALQSPGTRLGPGHTEAPPEEVAVYRALGLAWVPPELREARGELEAAAAGPLPVLVTRSDLLGAWHNHTDWSDGSDDLAAMAAAAAARGLRFLGISDHSRAAAYAHGLDAERLRQQAAAIAKLPPGGCRLLRGLEADILPDGRVDLSGEGIEALDFCVASVHSVFGMSQDDMTRRVTDALADPAVTMLGHATGRLLLAREGYALDMEAVLDACAEHEVVPELNASPHRLDLDTDALRGAKRRGLKIAINADAHHAAGLDDLRYGIAAARRAGLTPGDVANCVAPG